MGRNAPRRDQHRGGGGHLRRDPADGERTGEQRHLRVAAGYRVPDGVRGIPQRLLRGSGDPALDDGLVPGAGLDRLHAQHDGAVQPHPHARDAGGQRGGDRREHLPAPGARRRGAGRRLRGHRRGGPPGHRLHHHHPLRVFTPADLAGDHRRLHVLPAGDAHHRPFGVAGGGADHQSDALRLSDETAAARGQKGQHGRTRVPPCLPSPARVVAPPGSGFGDQVLVPSELGAPRGFRAVPGNRNGARAGRHVLPDQRSAPGGGGVRRPGVLAFALQESVGSSGA